MVDFGEFKPKAAGFPAACLFFRYLSAVKPATAGRTTASSVQAVLPIVIIVAVIRIRGRINFGMSGLFAVVGVARIATDRDQADIARAGVAVRGITATAAVTAVVPTVVSPAPTAVAAAVPRVRIVVAAVPTVVAAIPTVIPVTPTATVRIGNADIAVAIAAHTLETGIIARIRAAPITAEKIPKAVAPATLMTARIRAATVTVTGETVRITSIAHSVSILLEYLR